MKTADIDYRDGDLTCRGFLAYDETRTGEVNKNATVFGATRSGHEWAPYTERFMTCERVLIEAKIAMPGLGDVLRQIQFYRQFLDREDHDRDIWVVATPVALHRDFTDRLREESVEVIRLGDKFSRWVDERQRMPKGEDEGTLEV